MRKKLDTRFPAARIKKIMQADEDVGKIAMAVPLLVSKALELFLQDLCDRTYDVTLKRGAKTLNSLHLKQCVQTFNVFDFLRDIVNKVPDLGGSDAAGENCSVVAKRRKVEEEDDGSEDESKKKRIVLESDASHNSNNVRFRGRGRGRGRGRSSRTEKETSLQFEKSDAAPEISKYHDESQDNLVAHEAKKISPDEQNMEVSIRDFDLNVDLDENGDTRTTASADYARSPVKPASEITQGEYPGWSLSEMEKMAIHPIHLAGMSGRLDEEEDYDEEG